MNTLFCFYFLNPSMEKCDVCQKSFTSRSNMLQHIREIHDKNTKHTCNQCSRVYFRKSNLTRHLKACKGKQPSSSTGRVPKRKQSSYKTPSKKMKLDKLKFTMLSMQSITKVYIFFEKMIYSQVKINKKNKKKTSTTQEHRAK